MNYLTTAEAAARLGVDPSRVRHLIAAGRLKSKKLGRDHRIAEKNLDAVSKRVVGWPKGRRRSPAAETSM